MNEEIITLVKESFLSEKEKSFLLKIIENEGATNSFFEKFKILLIEEIKNISGEYKNAIEDLNAGSTEIDSWLEKQKEGLGKDAEKQLSETDMTDMKKKSEIWNNYDKKMLALAEEYKKKLSELTKKLMFSKIK